MEKDETIDKSRSFTVISYVLEHTRWDCKEINPEKEISPLFRRETEFPEIFATCELPIRELLTSLAVASLRAQGNKRRARAQSAFLCVSEMLGTSDGPGVNVPRPAAPPALLRLVGRKYRREQGNAHQVLNERRNFTYHSYLPRSTEVLQPSLFQNSS
jgi:hypothetical protein